MKTSTDESTSSTTHRRGSWNAVANDERTKRKIPDEILTPESRSEQTAALENHQHWSRRSKSRCPQNTVRAPNSRVIAEAYSHVAGLAAKSFQGFTTPEVVRLAFPTNRPRAHTIENGRSCTKCRNAIRQDRRPTEHNSSCSWSEILDCASGACWVQFLYWPRNAQVKKRHAHSNCQRTLTNTQLQGHAQD